jgi:hypothetical protein
LTSLCDNIWLHRGWHAPYKIPRTSSSSALAVGICSLAQNFHRRKQGNRYTALLKKENKCMASRKILFMYNPRLTDFYKILGERKLPPYPPKLLSNIILLFTVNDPKKVREV